MSTYHVYVSNSAEQARSNVERFADELGLSRAASALLEEWVVRAWDDGYVRVGMDGASQLSALEELHARCILDYISAGGEGWIIRPTVLASFEGAIAGIGWSKRIAVFDGPSMDETR